MIKKKLRFKIIHCKRCGEKTMGITKLGTCYDCIQLKIYEKKAQLKNKPSSNLI